MNERMALFTRRIGTIFSNLLIIGGLLFITASPVKATSLDFTTSCNGYSGCSYDSNGSTFIGCGTPADSFTENSYDITLYNSDEFLFYITSGVNYGFCTTWTEVGGGQLCAGREGNLQCVAYTPALGDVLKTETTGSVINCYVNGSLLATHSIPSMGSVTTQTICTRANQRISLMTYGEIPTPTPTLEPTATPTSEPPTPTPTPILYLHQQCFNPQTVDIIKGSATINTNSSGFPVVDVTPDVYNQYEVHYGGFVNITDIATNTIVVGNAMYSYISSDGTYNSFGATYYSLAGSNANYPVFENFGGNHVPYTPRYYDWFYTLSNYPSGQTFGLYFDPDGTAKVKLWVYGTDFGREPVHISTMSMCLQYQNNDPVGAITTPPTNPVTGICTIPTPFAIDNLNIGDWLSYYWCQVKLFITNLFGALADLPATVSEFFTTLPATVGNALLSAFVPTSSAQITTVKVLLDQVVLNMEQKAPLAYILLPIDFVNTFNWNTTPTELPVFTLHIGLPPPSPYNQDITLDLRPPDDVKTFMNTYLMPVGNIIVDIAFVMLYLRLAMWFLNINIKLGGVSDDTVEYNEWQNTHR